MAWSNTQNALKEFANVLKCMKCDSEPVLPTKNIPCGHIFCKECRGKESWCIKCNVPVQPTAVIHDTLTESLVRDCNLIGQIISQRNLWNPRMSKPISPVKTPVSTPRKTQLTSPNKRLSGGIKCIPKNINKINHQGETPLHTACIKGNEELVKNLLEAGAKPNTKDYTNWTPLQESVSFGYTNICRLLLEHGALPNTPGNENRTALHEAVLKNRVEETKLLLEYQANTNVFDQYGKRPRDYATGELLELLEQHEKLDETLNQTTHNQSLSIAQSSVIKSSNIVVYAPQLNKDNQELLSRMATKHNFRVASAFERNVTHFILETNGHYTTISSYDVMLAIIRGCWLIDSAWLSVGADIDDLAALDLEVFELSAAPIERVPRKARENAQQGNPGLFNNCNFYFAMQSKEVYSIGEVKFTKESLTKLVTEGGGTVLTREPDADHIKDSTLIPFHIANDSKHPLYKCTYYIIYGLGRKAEPRRMYCMSNIKSLPLLWLTESIERFTLVDPRHLGIQCT